MRRIFFGIENPFGDIFNFVSDIVTPKYRRHKIIKYMKEIAEDVEFEEIETVYENRETKITLQITE